MPSAAGRPDAPQLRVRHATENALALCGDLRDGWHAILNTPRGRANSALQATLLRSLEVLQEVESHLSVAHQANDDRGQLRLLGQEETGT